MPAFDRISSGIPGLDKSFDNIRLGDNVVFRVSSLRDFKSFVLPFVRQAHADHRKIIYVRFAEHEPILTDSEIAENAVEVHQIELSHRFETFTVSVHNLIRDEDRDAFYVFDCLSTLTTAWATDLMMGNFFRVTCPYLFSLDTVAYFPILRGRHSLSAVAKIQDTTQLFIDVYPDEITHSAVISDENTIVDSSKDDASPRLFVRPVKVWNRYSETMFLTHIFNTDTNEFRPILDGVEASAFYHVLGRNKRSFDDENIDSWDRFFNHAEDAFLEGEDMSEYCSRMCNIMMSRDEHMRKLIKNNFKPQNYFEIKKKMIGTGMIGGKSCGMLTARKIIENKTPEIYSSLEPHDSFYMGSDVFYSYLVDNDLWDLRVKQRTEKGYFSLADELSEKMKQGKFSGSIEQEILQLLDYYGKDPYIVRSSSILEDGFGNAFAGKYDSVFCINQGTVEDRLHEFENAARTVYASTMSKSALEYRKLRGLEKRDEQMALLIQRVSGSHYGRYVMPAAAGVGYSTSPYKMTQDIDSKKGMLRLVMGLGTAAVDRTEGSYPRIINLDRPTVSLYSTSKEKHEFSQKCVEYLDLSITAQNNASEGSQKQNDNAAISDKNSSGMNMVLKNPADDKNGSVVKSSPDILSPLLPAYIKNALFEHDYDAERFFEDSGRHRDVTFVSCKGLSENTALMDTFSALLQTLEKEYEYPVDIEFTINLSRDNSFIINLLQCRPLQTLISMSSSGSGPASQTSINNDSPASQRTSLTTSESAADDLSSNANSSQIMMPKNPTAENAIVFVKNSSMGLSMSFPIDEIIFVDPKEYYSLSYVKKPDVARIVGELNEKILSGNKKAVLFVPGRIGTSSPELGVPASFAEISGYSAIFEIAESSYGYNPELSFGSHIFQDLVETRILYTAIFENKNTVIFQPEKIKTGQPVKEGYPVYLLENSGYILFHDMSQDLCVIGDGSS